MPEPLVIYADTSIRFLDYLLLNEVALQIEARKTQEKIESGNKEERQKESVFAAAVEVSQTKEFINLLIDLNILEKKEELLEEREAEKKEAQIAEQEYSQKVDELLQAKKTEEAVLSYQDNIRKKLVVLDVMIQEVKQGYEIALNNLYEQCNGKGGWRETIWKPEAEKIVKSFVEDAVKFSTLPHPRPVNCDDASLKADMKELLSNMPAPHDLIRHNPRIKAHYDKAYAQEIKNGATPAKAVEKAMKVDIDRTMQLKIQLAAAHQAMKAGGGNVKAAAAFANNLSKKPIDDLLKVANDKPLHDLSNLTYKKNAAINELNAEKVKLNEALLKTEKKFHVEIAPVVDKDRAENMSKGSDAFTLINNLCKNQFIDPANGITVASLATEYAENADTRSTVDRYLIKFKEFEAKSKALEATPDPVEQAKLNKQIAHLGNSMQEDLGLVGANPIKLSVNPVADSIKLAATGREKLSYIESHCTSEIFGGKQIKYAADYDNDPKIKEKVDKIYDSIKAAENSGQLVGASVVTDLQSLLKDDLKIVNPQKIVLKQDPAAKPFLDSIKLAAEGREKLLFINENSNPKILEGKSKVKLSTDYANNQELRGSVDKVYDSMKQGKPAEDINPELQSLGQRLNLKNPPTFSPEVKKGIDALQETQESKQEHQWGMRGSMND